MKIKTKKQLNLPQLIEWGFENDVKNEYFLTHDSEGNTSEVHFDITGLPKFSSMVDKTDTFTVEVEEVVDSNTVLDNVYTVNVEEGTSHTTYYKSKSINEVKTDEINIIYTILQEEAIVLWDSQGGFR